jgi:uncharacterized membrane protein
MNESRLRRASQLIAVLGAAITVYLLYIRRTGGTLACTTGGCEAVQRSRYAELFGVPVAALGLFAFLGLFVAAAARGGWAQLVQATLAISALLFSAYLIYVQVAVIGDLCQWCLATDVLTSALAALAILRLRVMPISDALQPCHAPRKE